MSLLGQRPVTRRRFADGSYDAGGEFVNGAETLTVVQASVQELDSSQLQMLEEGERTMHPKILITEETDWRTSEADGKTVSDEVDFDGFTYRVLKTEQEHPLIPHFVVTVLRLQEAG